MEKELWVKIETIVDEALSRSGRERDSYITEQCKNDEALMGHVTRFLAEIQKAEEVSFLESEFK